MKKSLTLFSIAIVCIWQSCKKENVVPEIGKSYHIKSNIFNKGAFQPLQPVLVDSLYIDPLSGLHYARCKAQIDWANFALVASNKIELAGLQNEGINLNDTRIIEWYLPQSDLK